MKQKSLPSTWRERAERDWGGDQEGSSSQREKVRKGERRWDA